MLDFKVELTHTDFEIVTEPDHKAVHDAQTAR